jgi:hypothetical protein
VIDVHFLISLDMFFSRAQSHTFFAIGQKSNRLRNTHKSF